MTGLDGWNRDAGFMCLKLAIGKRIPVCFYHLVMKSVTVLLSRVQLLATPRTVARQAPLSKEFSRQEYWRGLPFPSPRDLPEPGIKPRSPEMHHRVTEQQKLLYIQYSIKGICYNLFIYSITE